MSLSHMFFAQYLMTSLFERKQTWYSGCPSEDPYWFSGYKCKGQCQTVGIQLLSVSCSVSLLGSYQT